MCSNTKNRNKQEVSDFSIVDIQLVHEALKSSVNCKHCRSRKSEMKLYKDDRKRHGMAYFISSALNVLMKQNFCQAKGLHMADLKSIDDLF